MALHAVQDILLEREAIQMINQLTVDTLKAMRMSAMAQGLEA